MKELIKITTNEQGQQLVNAREKLNIKSGSRECVNMVLRKMLILLL